MLCAANVSEAAPALRSASVVLTQLEIPVAAAGSAMEQGHANGAITVLNPAPACALPAAVLDTATLSRENADELASLIAAAEHSASDRTEPPKGSADLAVHVITIDDGAERTVLRGNDAGMTREFAALLAWLQKHLKIRT